MYVHLFFLLHLACKSNQKINGLKCGFMKAHVLTPKQFLTDGIEEIIAMNLHHINGKVLFAHYNFHRRIHYRIPGIEANQIVR